MATININKIKKGDLTRSEIWTRFGTNPDIDMGTPEDVWGGGGIYAGFPTDLETLEVVSSSTNDSDPFGTGAHSVLIAGLLDTSFNALPPVIVNLNGTTPVSLGVQSYRRASIFQVVDTGSSNANTGVITLRHSFVTSHVFATIDPGQNQTQLAAYTVPTGRTLFIEHILVSMGIQGGSSASANMELKIKNTSDQIFRVIKNQVINTSNNYEYNGGPFLVIPEKFDIKIGVFDVSNNNTSISAEASGFLIQNPNN